MALITDLHFGARSDSLLFDSFFATFYSETFFPTLKKENITDVFLLGDIFDRRKFVNFNILRNCKRYFFDELEIMGIKVNIIVGNHDIYFKNTNDVNSLELLLAEYSNITIYKDPTEITLDELNVLLVPWINSENIDATFHLIDESLSTVCFGHLEIAGFTMHQGEVSDHGMDRKIFDRFDMVFSGHYHHRSSDGSIYYLGNPYEITWSDYNDPRGFHIFDTKTLELTFIANPFTMFKKVYYDEDDEIFSDFASLKDKHIKVIVVNKTDYYKFDRFIDTIYQNNPAELKIVEDFDNLDDVSVDGSIDIEDTLSLLSHYVDSVETDMEKPRIKSTLKALYVEASNKDEG